VTAPPVQLHATAIVSKGMGVAIIGASGSGKSDLALRLIDRGAQLVCDDRIELVEIDGEPWMLPATNIAGKIEVRGLGIIEMPYLAQAPLRLIVDLDQPPERYPDPLPTQEMGGFACPKLCVSAFEASAPIKLELAVQSLLDNGRKPVRL
jgi:HPr kinase/phosphorylase